MYIINYIIATYGYNQFNSYNKLEYVGVTILSMFTISVLDCDSCYIR